MPGEYNVSTTFNVSDLSPFDVGDDLRTNPFQEEGNDEDMSNTRAWNADSIQVPIGPVTRARAKRFKQGLNGLIQYIWAENYLGGPKSDSIQDLQGWVSVIQALE